MCNPSVLEFFSTKSNPEHFSGKRVLEVGSAYVNGSVRPLIEHFCYPKEYIGVDIQAGRYVDVVLPAERLVEHFGPNSFNVVLSTEMLEHVKDWRVVVDNMKAVLKPGGYTYITTRSKGFPYHAYPHDYWRYELEDMKRIFSDFETVVLERDYAPDSPGVFMIAKKPIEFHPAKLSDFGVYSMILGARTFSTPDPWEMPLSRRIRVVLMDIARRAYYRVGGFAWTEHLK